MQYKLKKSLGQHFLKDENICKKIVAEIEKTLKESEVQQLLEVGSGAGAITKYLLQIPGINMKIVELDIEKVEYLRATYPSIKEWIIHKNFLDIEVPFEGEFAVAGNFPYNISSQILFKILQWKQQVPVMVGMFQKEVGQRIASQPGSKVYGILSVLVQAFYSVDYLFEVHEQCFNPPPKVKSAVIRLTRKKDRIKMNNERDFSVLVKTAFNQRRKTLRNATRNLFEESFLQNEIFNKRPEQLSIEDFGALTFSMI
jgi:16S rRNA (adenine1518-N6/adenine1519-N6)-dimethyltransferase